MSFDMIGQKKLEPHSDAVHQLLLAASHRNKPYSTEPAQLKERIRAAQTLYRANLERGES